MRNETIDTLAAIGGKASATGVGMTGVGWFLSNEFFGLVGAFVAVGGLVLAWYYKREANRRQLVEHELRVARLRRGMKSDTDLAVLGGDD
jgi:preprotein translocase subunit SecG